MTEQEKQKVDLQLLLWKVSKWIPDRGCGQTQGEDQAIEAFRTLMDEPIREFAYEDLTLHIMVNQNREFFLEKAATSENLNLFVGENPTLITFASPDAAQNFVQDNYTGHDFKAPALNLTIRWD